MILLAGIPLVLGIVCAIHGAVEARRSYRVELRHSQILDNLLYGE